MQHGRNQGGFQMLDGVALPEMQRSKGRAVASFDCARGKVRLVDLSQSGSAKAMLPRVSGDVPEVVFLNTSGGLTDSDLLEYRLSVGPGAKVTATTQTAERAYRSAGAAATVAVRADVGAGGHLAWLPQETILYENSHLRRSTQIDLAGDATCLLTESLVLGRHAMGEELHDARLRDSRLVRRDGRPIWAENLALDAAFLATAQTAALLGQARAFAVVALIGQGAADAVTRLRAELNEPGCEAEASGWDGKCIARIVARDGWPMKRQLHRALRVLHQGPLPRVWQMQGEIA